MSGGGVTATARTAVCARVAVISGRPPCGVVVVVESAVSGCVTRASNTPPCSPHAWNLLEEVARPRANHLVPCDEETVFFFELQ